MPAVKHRKTLLVILPLILILCFGLWFLRVHFPYLRVDFQEISSENGVWDLRNIDFDKGFVKLTGDGETILNALLSPSEFNARAGEAEYGCYEDAPLNTTRLRVLLPEDDRYMIVGVSVDYAERIFINGAWRQDVGTVGLSADASVPGSAYLVLETDAPAGEVEILRQSCNFIHWTLRNPVNLHIGKAETMRQFAAQSTDQTGFVMGMLLTLFVAHGLLYSVMRQYRANLYFALLCLSWCLRTGVTGVMLIPTWFPEVPFSVYFRMEYALVAVAAVSILLVILEVFPSALPRWAVFSLYLYLAVYFILCLVVPVRPLSELWIPSAIVYILYIIFIALRLTWLVWRRRKSGSIQTEQWIVLVGLLFLFFTAVQDVFFYTGYTDLGILNDFGFLVFSLFQMAANFYGTMREIEEVHAVEQEARLEAETLRRVGALQEEFLYSLSHELQMPLTVVSGFAQLTGKMIADDMPDQLAIAENMHRIEDEAGRMERMVLQLLDAAAMKNGSFTLRRSRFDMGALIKTVAEIHFPVMDYHQNELIIEAASPLFVYGDEERLLQVLLNLLSNAVKHTQQGRITLAMVAEEACAVVTMEDTGDGIASELLPKLFQRFSKDEVTGNNGFGLYICKHIVEAHGGTIEIASVQAGGTKVRFMVPLWKEEL